METPDADVTLERIAIFNEIIIRLTNQYSAVLVDLRQFEPSPTLVNDNDGFHPSNEGHALIADLFLEVIEPLISE